MVSPKGLGKELNCISGLPYLCDEFVDMQLASWRNVWLPGRRIHPASGMRLGLRPCECRRHRQARAGKQAQAAQAKNRQAQPSTCRQAGAVKFKQSVALACPVWRLAWSPGHASAAGLGRSFGQRALAQAVGPCQGVMPRQFSGLGVGLLTS